VSANVYANGMEVSGKASPNKSIAAMPDTCLSPPSPPAGPIPIPYPNTAMASDTADGSKTVKLGGEEAGLKNESKYKQSNGDEPATNSFGAGVVSHKITGAMKFAAWSMDVSIEGANATRFGDLTTHNHMNNTNGAATSSIAGLSTANPADVTCKELSQGNKDARNDMSSGKHGKDIKEVGDGNTTITHARYTNRNGVAGFMRACSRATVHKYDNSFNSGLTTEEKHAIAKKDPNYKVKSKAKPPCNEHQYRRAFMHPHTSHTEARMLEDIFRNNPQGGGRILMSIDWPGGQAAGKNRKSPCDDCQKLICAVKDCIEIKICDEMNEPQSPKCDDE
jgi:hypothetical protein